MAEYVKPVYEIYINNSCYNQLTNITAIDLHNTPWVNNDASYGLNRSYYITSVSGLNDNITNLSYTLNGCFTLNYISHIPSKATRHIYCF